VRGSVADLSHDGRVGLLIVVTVVVVVGCVAVRHSVGGDSGHAVHAVAQVVSGDDVAAAAGGCCIAAVATASTR